MRLSLRTLVSSPPTSLAAGELLEVVCLSRRRVQISAPHMWSACRREACRLAASRERIFGGVSRERGASQGAHACGLLGDALTSSPRPPHVLCHHPPLAAEAHC